MKSSHDLFRQLTADKELVTEFFIVFSRFEYALKRGNYVNRNERDEVTANWDRLAADLRNSFQPNRTEDLQQSVEYLQSHPPRKQIWRDGDLDWAESVRPPNEPQLLSLLCFIRTIRNNLFHGGKFPRSPVPDLSRDSTLLKSSLIILEECLQLCEQVSFNVYYHFFHLGEPEH